MGCLDAFNALNVIIDVSLLFPLILSLLRLRSLKDLTGFVSVDTKRKDTWRSSIFTPLYPTYKSKSLASKPLMLALNTPSLPTKWLISICAVLDKTWPSRPYAITLKSEALAIESPKRLRAFNNKVATSLPFALIKLLSIVKLDWWLSGIFLSSKTSKSTLLLKNDL